MIRKPWALISMQHALMLTYRAEIYLWVLAHLLPFIMMSIWMTGAGTAGAHFAMDPLGYARYFFAAFVVRQFTAVWMIYEFEYFVQEGRLSYLLLRPINPIWHFITGHLGEQMARFPFFVVISGVFFCIYPKALWRPTVGEVVLGVTAIYMAFSVRYAIGYCMSMMTFWLERASALDQLLMVPYLFLSGMIVPLGDFPPRVAAIVRLTPFPYFIDFPARIITGKLTVMDAGLYEGLAISLGWLMIFAGIGAGLWKRGLYRYSGRGHEMFRVLRVFWSTSLSSEMEYRLNFVTSALNSLGQLVGTLFAINVLYGKGYQFQGWSKDETYLVVALFTLMDGISTSALSPNLSKIVWHVQKGTLDFLLLKPVDAQFQLSTRNLTPWGFPNMFFALVLIGYAGHRLGLGAGAYMMGIVPMMLALVILYSMWFAVGTTTIWFTKVWNATEVLRSLLEAGKYPMGAYQSGVRFVLTFILPVAFLTTVPVEVMRGVKGPAFIVVEAALAGGMFVGARLFWKWALRSYTSASS